MNDMVSVSWFLRVISTLAQGDLIGGATVNTVIGRGNCCQAFQATEPIGLSWLRFFVQAAERKTVLLPIIGAGDFFVKEVFVLAGTRSQLL